MPDSLTDALSRHFGHAGFRPGQREVIERIVDGTRTLALFPTSAGKSLCFQLPALLLPDLTLVVSPLIALMQDQVDSLRRKDIPAARLDSSLAPEEAAEIFTHLESGHLKLLYISPERIAHRDTLARLKRLRISLVAVDEAHCFSRWGQSFRPDYRRLPGVVRALRPGTVLALTATASPAVAQDIRKSFRILARDEVRLPLQRENLSWHVTPLPPEQKLAHLIASLREKSRLPAVVYCTRQITTVEVAAAIEAEGFSCRSFHAGIPPESRSGILEGFLAGKFDVIVATIAFGMGVDKPDIRSVFHYEVPRSPEAWVQEAGRAGRDEAPAHTEVIAAANDFVAHRNITEASRPRRVALERLLGRIFTGAKEVLLSPWQLTTDLDLSRQAFDTVLTLLEIEKVIERRASLHRKLTIRTIRPAAKCLASLAPADRKRLAPLLATRGWQDLLADDPPPSAVTKTYTALQELETAGDVAIRWSHQLHLYRIARPDQINLTAFIDQFDLQAEETFEAEISRLAAVEKILTSKRCIEKSLFAHLGEKSAPACGRCSRCLGEPYKRKLPSGKTPAISPDEFEQIQRLIEEKISAMRSPAQLTRHLLGIGSPASFAKRLYRRDTYGLLAAHDWHDIIATCEAMS